MNKINNYRRKTRKRSRLHSSMEAVFVRCSLASVSACDRMFTCSLHEELLRIKLFGCVSPTCDYFMPCGLMPHSSLCQRFVELCHRCRTENAAAGEQQFHIFLVLPGVCFKTGNSNETRVCNYCKLAASLEHSRIHPMDMVHMARKGD